MKFLPATFAANYFQAGFQFSSSISNFVINKITIPDQTFNNRLEVRKKGKLTKSRFIDRLLNRQTSLQTVQWVDKTLNFIDTIIFCRNKIQDELNKRLLV